MPLEHATYRAMRAGGAFGRLAHVSPQLSVSKERLCSARCDARVPRAAAGTVTVPVDEGSGLLAVWKSTERDAAAALPAGTQPPVSGADATGNELFDLMMDDNPLHQDAVDMLARSTTTKVGLACVLFALVRACS